GSRCLVRVDPIWKVSRHKPFIISLKPRLQLQQLYPGAMNDMQLPCPLILASSSPYRAVLLRRLGLPFEQLSPAVDESPRPGEPGPELALRLARTKAAAVADAHPDAVVIGSDQVPVCNDHLLEKPGAREPAIAQLRACSGQQITFYTALAICRGTVCHSLSIPTRVVMRRLADAQIER